MTRAALPEPNMPWEQVYLTDGDVNQTPASIIQRPDGPYQWALDHIPLEPSSQDVSMPSLNQQSTCGLALTAGNFRKMESPGPLKKLGSRAQGPVAKSRLPGTCIQTQTTSLAPGWVPSCAISGAITFLNVQ